MSTATATPATKLPHPIIYHYQLKEGHQLTNKRLNPYYITNFKKDEQNEKDEEALYPLIPYKPAYNRYDGYHFKQGLTKLFMIDMDGVPALLRDSKSVYSIIEEIHLTQGPPTQGTEKKDSKTISLEPKPKIINPHITIIFKDKSKCAYYFRDPVEYYLQEKNINLREFFQINNDDMTPPGTPQQNKLSFWFINLGKSDHESLEGLLGKSVKFWLLSMLQNYLMSFDLLNDSYVSSLFPHGTALPTLIGIYPHMTLDDYPSPEQGFFPPSYTLNCKTPPKSQFKFEQFQFNKSATAKAKGLNKKTRRKPSRGKPSRRKPSRRKLKN
jgi:hypothetical protein